ncbi:helix-turn-helix domain-containing protein [Streptomyces sp. 15-116A]|uniref:helix-turn-helix transcriptional regulator n=1 Tax=Streptomyces sp. 15-116A TaxID=2259035 RepID=UPI0021B36826|nr:helix-turn-helix domain-containing protein [Streptomyces sp. 15-116A]MCT7353622.1 helix-turn-helix domain-containing protein [Streptomyces sp. 15-116A]
MPRASLPQVTDAQRRKLATAQELADYCGVPIGTVYQWASRGGGPRLIKVGRHLRARWDDIEKWLDSQTIQA